MQVNFSWQPIDSYQLEVMQRNIFCLYLCLESIFFQSIFLMKDRNKIYLKKWKIFVKKTIQDFMARLSRQYSNNFNTQYVYYISL